MLSKTILCVNMHSFPTALSRHPGAIGHNCKSRRKRRAVFLIDASYAHRLPIAVNSNIIGWGGWQWHVANLNESNLNSHPRWAWITTAFWGHTCFRGAPGRKRNDSMCFKGKRGVKAAEPDPTAELSLDRRNIQPVSLLLSPAACKAAFHWRPTHIARRPFESEHSQLRSLRGSRR